MTENELRDRVTAAQVARAYLREARLTARQCELLEIALSTHGKAVMAELAENAGTKEMEFKVFPQAQRGNSNLVIMLVVPE